MRSINEIIVDDFIYKQRQHAAFADALEGLFRRYPLPDYVHEMHLAVRESALRKARTGGYMDYAPNGATYWRRQVMENAREDWRVPMEEVVAIHALIYG